MVPASVGSVSMSAEDRAWTLHGFKLKSQKSIKSEWQTASVQRGGVIDIVLKPKYR